LLLKLLLLLPPIGAHVGSISTAVKKFYPPSAKRYRWKIHGCASSENRLETF
jgi:hypothetical protein